MSKRTPLRSASGRSAKMRFSPLLASTASLRRRGLGVVGIEESSASKKGYAVVRWGKGDDATATRVEARIATLLAEQTDAVALADPRLAGSASRSWTLTGTVGATAGTHRVTALVVAGEPAAGEPAAAGGTVAAGGAAPADGSYPVAGKGHRGGNGPAAGNGPATGDGVPGTAVDGAMAPEHPAPSADAPDLGLSYELLVHYRSALVAAGYGVEDVFEGWRTVALDVCAAATATGSGARSAGNGPAKGRGTDATAPAAGGPVAAAPEPATAGDLDAVDATPAPSEAPTGSGPDPTTAAAEPAPVEPVAAVVEPPAEPAAVEPEPAAVEPEPAAVEPVAAAVEPPAAASRPAGAEPEAVVAEAAGAGSGVADGAGSTGPETAVADGVAQGAAGEATTGAPTAAGEVAAELVADPAADADPAAAVGAAAGEAAGSDPAPESTAVAAAGHDARSGRRTTDGSRPRTRRGLLGRRRGAEKAVATATSGEAAAAEPENPAADCAPGGPAA